VLSDYLTLIGFEQSTADPCVYTKRAVSSMVVIAVYVDDLIVAANTMEEMTNVKECLSRQFRMKDLGKLQYCLGITVEQNEAQHYLKIHQEQYILNMLVKFKMTEAKTVATRVDISVKLQKDDSYSKDVDPTRYQSLVGSLLYTAIATRPDIAQSVGIVSKYSSRPTKAHLTDFTVP